MNDDRSRQAPFRHLLAHVTQREIDQRGLREAEQVADARDDHGVDLDVVADLGERVGEVLQDQDGARARVVQLVLQLARRVHRVDVDDREAGPECADDRHGVLQDVRQHDRDPVALAQPRHLLQVSGEPAGEQVEVAVSQRPFHAGEAGPVPEPGDALLDQCEQRAVFGRIDFGRHAGLVLRQPDLIHDKSPVCGPPCRAGLQKLYNSVAGRIHRDAPQQKSRRPPQRGRSMGSRGFQTASSRRGWAAAFGWRPSSCIRLSSSATSASRNGTWGRAWLLASCEYIRSKSRV